MYKLHAFETLRLCFRTETPVPWSSRSEAKLLGFSESKKERLYFVEWKEMGRESDVQLLSMRAERVEKWTGFSSPFRNRLAHSECFFSLARWLQYRLKCAGLAFLATLALHLAFGMEHDTPSVHISGVAERQWLWGGMRTFFLTCAGWALHESWSWVPRVRDWENEETVCCGTLRLVAYMGNAWRRAIF